MGTLVDSEDLDEMPNTLLGLNHIFILEILICPLSYPGTIVLSFQAVEYTSMQRVTRALNFIQ